MLVGEVTAVNSVNNLHPKITQKSDFWDCHLTIMNLPLTAVGQIRSVVHCLNPGSMNYTSDALIQNLGCLDSSHRCLNWDLGCPKCGHGRAAELQILLFRMPWVSNGSAREYENVCREFPEVMCPLISKTNMPVHFQTKISTLMKKNITTLPNICPR